MDPFRNFSQPGEREYKIHLTSAPPVEKHWSKSRVSLWNHHQCWSPTMGAFSTGRPLSHITQRSDDFISGIQRTRKHQKRLTEINCACSAASQTQIRTVKKTGVPIAYFRSCTKIRTEGWGRTMGRFCQRSIRECAKRDRGIHRMNLLSAGLPHSIIFAILRNRRILDKASSITCVWIEYMRKIK